MQDLVGKNIEIAVLGIILLGFMASLSHWATRSTTTHSHIEPYMTTTTDSIEIDQSHSSWHSPEIGN